MGHQTHPNNDTNLRQWKSRDLAPKSDYYCAVFSAKPLREVKVKGFEPQNTVGGVCLFPEGQALKGSLGNGRKQHAENKDVYSLNEELVSPWCLLGTKVRDDSYLEEGDTSGNRGR